MIALRLTPYDGGCRYNSTSWRSPAFNEVRRCTMDSFMVGRVDHVRIFRGCERGNPYKVAEHGRKNTSSLYSRLLDRDPVLLAKLLVLQGCSLSCQCSKDEACHGDVIATRAQQLITEWYSPPPELPLLVSPIASTYC